MAERSHLSIGEVLSLLRDEFPDVTISKIRFLESQGLVDPERTPSGYRKFYEHDVDRLRWILQQQREKFLPLKVIRGQLNKRDDATTAGTVADETAGTNASSNGTANSNTHSNEMSEEAGAPEEDPHASVTSGQDASDRRSTPEQPHLGRAAASALESPGGATPAAVQPAEPTAPPSSPRAPSSQPASPVTGAAADEGPVKGGGVTPSSQRREADEAIRRTFGSADDPRFDRHAEAARRASDRERAGMERPAGADDTLTVEELARASGLEPEAVRELEQFGLVHSQMVGRTSYYDREALAVTRVAAAFARHGIGARHLRAYRNSAEREAGLFEAVVLPLVRQRNPASRQAATETIEELCALGADLRALLIRQALSDLR